ncbi:hypothetical protein HDV00_002068 [Rhizophlyctis rosea]|nr:hypothetical protein HDV00_002068 [Rhizophlyctis rosea]
MALAVPTTLSAMKAVLQSVEGEEGITSQWTPTAAYVDTDKLFILDHNHCTASVFELRTPVPNVDFSSSTHRYQSLDRLSYLDNLETTPNFVGSLHTLRGLCVFSTPSHLHLWDFRTARHVKFRSDNSSPHQIFLSPTVILLWKPHHTTPTIHLHSLTDLHLIRTISIPYGLSSAFPPPRGTTLPNDEPKYQVRPLPVAIPSAQISPCGTRIITVLKSEYHTGNFKLDGMQAPRWSFRDRTVTSTFFCYDLVANTTQICSHEGTYAHPDDEIGRDWGWCIDPDGDGRRLKVVSCLGGAKQKKEKKKQRKLAEANSSGQDDNTDQEGATGGGAAASGGGQSSTGKNDWWDDAEFEELFKEGGGSREGGVGEGSGKEEGEKEEGGKKGGQKGGGGEEGGEKEGSREGLSGGVVEDAEFMEDEEFERLFDDIEKEADA